MFLSPVFFKKYPFNLVVASLALPLKKPPQPCVSNHHLYADPLLSSLPVLSVTLLMVASGAVVPEEVAGELAPPPGRVTLSSGLPPTCETCRSRDP